MVLETEILFELRKKLCSISEVQQYHYSSTIPWRKKKKIHRKGSHPSRNEPSATRSGHFGETLETLIQQWINKEHWIKEEMRSPAHKQRTKGQCNGKEMKQKSHVLITRPESSSSSIFKVAEMRLQGTVFWYGTLFWSVDRSFSSWLLEQQSYRKKAVEGTGKQRSFFLQTIPLKTLPLPRERKARAGENRGRENGRNRRRSEEPEGLWQNPLAFNSIQKIKRCSLTG